MEQDFAKLRTRTPLAEPETRPQPSSAGLLFTGLLTGIALGLFASLLVWVSGILPPSPGQQTMTVAGAPDQQPSGELIDSAAGNDPEQLTIELEREAARLQLEFYQELPNYEVVVDVTPVNVPQPRVTTPPPAAVTSRDPDEGSDQSSTAGTTPGSETGSLPTQEPDRVQVADMAATQPAGQGSFLLQAGAFQQQNTANAQANRLRSLGLTARVRQEFLSGRTLFLVQAGPYATRDDMMQAERLLRSNNIETMRITLSQP